MYHHQSAPATSAPSPARPDRKLRLSCDSCFSAKVKCSKDRPSCVRCSSVGLVCHYSVSRRAGKPKASQQKGRASTGKGPASSSASLDGSCATDLDCSAYAPTMDEADVERLCRSMLLEHPPTFDPNVTRCSGSGNVASANFTSFMTPFSTNEQFPGLSPPQSAPPTSLDAQTMSSSSGDDPSGSMPGYSSAQHSGGSPTEDFFSSIFSPVDLQYLNQSLQDFDAQASDASASGSSSGCGCGNTLQEIMGVLQNLPTAATFDQVLVLNKYAVGRLTSFVSCSHPMDISCLMFITATLGKVMHAFKTRIEKSGTEDKALTLGCYQVDHDDEQRIMMVLVNAEIGKVESLLQLIQERFEQALSPDERPVFETNMNFLRRKIRETVCSP